MAYAAIGAAPWSSGKAGLVSRIGNNIPNLWLKRFSKAGFNIEGIHTLDGSLPTTRFYHYSTWDKCGDSEPLRAYSQLNIPCPAALLNYHSPVLDEAESAPSPLIALRPDDIPSSYRLACSAFLTPCHLTSQITLQNALRQNGVETIALSPSERIMSPPHVRDIALLLHGIDICFVVESQARCLLRNNNRDVREITEALATFGPKIVLLQRGLDGFSMYDADARRHSYLPAYPIKMQNPIGIGDSFCGGFLAGWKITFDPFEAALRGCISASLAGEGLGAFFPLERNRLLAEARLQSLRRLVSSPDSSHWS